MIAKRYTADELLALLKDEAKFLTKINAQIFKALLDGDEKLKGAYEAQKTEAINTYNENIRNIVSNNDNLLTNFVKANKNVFIQYFKSYSSLSDNPEWFIEEFKSSKSTYEEVFRAPDNDRRSSFNYDFHFLCLELSGLLISERQLNQINGRNKSLSK
jgi:hypothetical protein